MGVFFAPWGFFFLKGFTVVFDSKILFFEQKKFEKNFFESKTTVNPLRKKKPMGQKNPPWGKQTLLQKQTQN